MAKTPVKSPGPQRNSGSNLKSPCERKDSRGNSKMSKDRIRDDETKVVAVKYPSGEAENCGVGVSSEEVEKVQQNGRSHFKEDKEQNMEKIKSFKRKGKEVEVKNEKKKIREKENGEDLGEKIEHALYKFPMNRVDKIIRSENSGVRISQEAVFVINKASEKLLELFSREAYACAFIQSRSYIAYDHLSSVVSRRKRFDFISDFIPEKVKAEDALTQISETEK